MDPKEIKARWEKVATPKTLAFQKMLDLCGALCSIERVIELELEIAGIKCSVDEVVLFAVHNLDYPG